jgi:hypothetical protein
VLQQNILIDEKLSKLLHAYFRKYYYFLFFTLL